MTRRTLTWDSRALPGIVVAAIGGLVCWLWLGWDYGLAFIIGAAFGSTRSN